MKRAIDSLTIIVPFDLVTRYDYRLVERVIEVYENLGTVRNQSDLDNPTKSNRKPIFHEENGIKTRIGAKSFFGKNCLLVTATSKMLRSSYLDGINYTTVNILFDYLMSLDIFTMSFSDFLNCNVFDVDIKTDYQFDSYYYDKELREKRKVVKGSKLYLNSDKTVQGIQYGNRNNTTPTSPFVKTYSKGIELLENSTEFREKYLPTFFDTTLRRTEVTIANAKAVDYLLRKKVISRKLVTFHDWLSLSQEQLLNIITFQVNHWENPYNFEKIRKKQDDKPLTSSDFALMKMYELLKKEKYTIQDMANLLNSFPAKPSVLASSKARFKRKIKKFDQIITQTSDQLKSLGVYKYL